VSLLPLLGNRRELKVESQLCRKADTSSLDLHTPLVAIEIHPQNDATKDETPKGRTNF
jgi:hypothetical protein